MSKGPSAGKPTGNPATTRADTPTTPSADDRVMPTSTTELRPSTSAISSDAAPLKETPVMGAGIDPAEIEREAYFVWLERGGNEVVNWLEAERRVKTRHVATAAGQSV